MLNRRIVEQGVHWLALTALILFLTIELYLKRIPEAFLGAARIGSIISGLCLSIISSYLFYLIVVHVKAKRDKQNTKTYVRNKVSRTVGRCRGFLNDLGATQGHDADMLWIDPLMTSDVLAKINPNSEAPLTIDLNRTKATWLQYTDYKRRESLVYIEQLFRFMPLLDSELAALLGKLEENLHFGNLSMNPNIPIRNTDMSWAKDQIITYVQICKELDAYRQRKLSD